MPEKQDGSDLQDESLEGQPEQPSLKASMQKLEKDVLKTSVVDKVIEKTGAENVSEDHKQALHQILSKIDADDLTNNPEENPKVMLVAIKQLDDWGYKVAPIHRESLKIETETDELSAKLNERVTDGKMPTTNYPSNVGVYGFSTVMAGEDTMSYVKSGKHGVVDRFENLLRTSGDAGGNVLTALLLKSKRSKASMEEIARNIEELGMGEYFEVVREGDKVVSINEKITDVKQGAFLDDLLRNPDNHEFLNGLDTQAAVKMTAEALANVHEKSGRGLGEVLANDIVLQVEDGKVKGVRFALPDMKFKENVQAVAQKAYDVLDICFSLGSAGMQKGGDKGLVLAKSNIEAFALNYKDAEVKQKAVEMLNDGTPQLTMHNKVRLGFDRVEQKESAFNLVKETVIEYLSK